jgi:hypothetical protein
MEQEGINYNNTYILMVKFATIQIVLSIATAKEMHIMQFDVRTVFPYKDVDEVIFMDQPRGFIDETHTLKKWQLLKAL